MTLTTRILPTSAAAPPVTGPNYMNAVSENVAALWNVARLPLTVTGGTANSIQASCTPPLVAGPVDGMSFIVVPASDTTGAVEVKINGASAIDVLTVSADPLSSGAMLGGTAYELIYNAAANGLLLLGAVKLVPTLLTVQRFDVNGTYTPTAGMRFAVATLLGAGASGGKVLSGGGRASGGGPGALVKGMLLPGDVGISKPVTIGAGGAPQTVNGNGNDGGATSIGSLLSAAGGVKGVYNGSVDVAGGAAGVASGGFLNMTGQRGGDALGSGGSANGYGGRALQTISGLGGSGFAAGGAGGSIAAGPSGAGAPGLVLIEEFT